MIDRTQQPEIKPVDTIDFIRPGTFDLTTNTRLFCMTNVPNETAKFELYFDAGTIRGKSELASFVNGLLLSGTKHKTSIEINEEINALGGFLEQGVSNENAVVTVYALRENILAIARILQDAIQHCVFDEHEFEQLKKERRQSFKVNMEKVSYLAQRSLRQRLFSNSETYGAVTQEGDFETITVSDLKSFHQNHYLEGLNKLALIGHFSQDEIDAFMDIFGSWSIERKPVYEANFLNLKGLAHTEKDNAVQTAVRLGRQLFNKQHPDYPDFLVLHTILGDYFGSRLMSNIREDKGYTYGIGSMIGELQESGYFIIATEVGKEVKDATLDEIRFEMERLQREPVGEEELTLVKNYMLGQLLKSADGAYSIMDLFLSVEQLPEGLEFYNGIIKHIHAITPDRIQELAKRYLNWSDFTVVTAG